MTYKAKYQEGAKAAPQLPPGFYMEREEAARRVMTHAEVIKQFNQGRRDFSGVIIPNANFASLQLPGIIFKGAEISNGDFSFTNLSGADFSEAVLTRCSFTGAILKNTNFEKANLSWSIFRAAFFEGTNLRRANLSWAHLCRNDLIKTDFTDADLTLSCWIDSNVSQQQLTGVPREMLWTVTRQGKDHGDIRPTVGMIEQAEWGGLGGGTLQKRGTYGAVEGGHVGYGAVSGEGKTGYASEESGAAEMRGVYGTFDPRAKDRKQQC